MFGIFAMFKIALKVGLILLYDMLYGQSAHPKNSCTEQRVHNA